MAFARWTQVIPDASLSSTSFAFVDDARLPWSNLESMERDE